MSRKNPMDEVTDQIVSAMHSAVKYQDSLSEGVTPYQSRKLNSDEERLAWQNPAALYPGEQMSNAQAAARFYEEIGPVDYVKWAESMTKQDGQEGTEQ